MATMRVQMVTPPTAWFLTILNRIEQKLDGGGDLGMKLIKCSKLPLVLK